MRSFVLLLASTAALPAYAQQPPSAAATPGTQAPAQAADADPEEEAGEEIVVTGSRTQRGAVVGDIAPEQQLSPADIRSYGVSSVTELLNELSPQTNSGRGAGGAPVVLLNGRRISGFREIRDLPTEAIQRVDILPEEVALKYGYRADQRVVNFVLRRRFKAVTAELEDRFATEGGRNTPGAELDVLRIRGDRRVNLHMEYSRPGALTEAERDIIQAPNAAAVGGNVAALNRGAIDPSFGTATSLGVPASAATQPPALGDFSATRNATDQGAYRTLLPQQRTFSANGTYATSIFGEVADDASKAVVDAIAAVPTGAQDRPKADVVLHSVDVVAV